MDINLSDEDPGLFPLVSKQCKLTLLVKRVKLVVNPDGFDIITHKIIVEQRACSIIPT